jgi:dipeptidyl aminopeptidase/acylaminoacyl peptidase
MHAMNRRLRTFGSMGPISAERCIAGRELTEPQLSPDGTRLVYAMSSVGGASLMLSTLDGGPSRQLTAYPQPRTGRGLGGGCWCWAPDSAAVIYAGADGNLWLQPVPGGQVRRLTGHGPERTAQAPMVTPSGDGVVYSVDQLEVWLQPLPDGEPRRLDDGSADFCFDPFVTPGGSGVVWQAWNVPDMAWDAARVQRVTFDGSATDSFQPNGALQQPRAMPDGTEICIRDDGGWNNIWLGDTPLVDEPFEHAGPTGGPGQRSFAPSPDGTAVAFTRNERGVGRLCVVEVATGVVREIARGVHAQLSWRGQRLTAIRTGARTPTQVVVYDVDRWERAVIDTGPVSGWEQETLVEPDLVEVVARDGEVVHARLYRADEPTDQLMVWLHGGPTDQWQVTFMPRISYWRSRGFNVLVPDHRGSSGHGRAYQQAMNGRWGELDVDDIVDVVRHAHTSGWGSPAQTVMLGGSAGGFTVLGVLAADPALAAAGVVSYPVTDLADLAERSHRFERHYTNHLVGPIEGGGAVPQRYLERSPVTFAHRIRTPLLMLHGDVDPVVPVEQSRVMATRIAEAGGIVALCVYPGEGHGFRQPENQLDEYRRVGEFIAEHVG